MSQAVIYQVTFVPREEEEAETSGPSSKAFYQQLGRGDGVRSCTSVSSEAPKKDAVWMVTAFLTPMTLPSAGLLDTWGSSWVGVDTTLSNLPHACQLWATELL